MTGEAIFVTGATGFVGRHLVPALLRAGHKLVIATRTPHSLPRDLATASAEVVDTGPLESSTVLEQSLSGVRTVVHLAGLTPGSAGSHDGAFTSANETATARLVEAAARSDVRTFIFLSSVLAASGNASSMVIDDTTSPKPAGAYGRSKRAAERYVEAFAADGRTGISLRPPLIVGSGAKGNWRTLQTLAAGGLPLPFASVSNRRSLIAVETIVAALDHLCARRRPAEASGAYALADRGPMSLAEILTTLRRGMGVESRLFPIPTSVLRAGLALTGQERRAAALLGNLEIDATRFARTFDFHFPPAEEGVRNSGAGYLALRNER